MTYPPDMDTECVDCCDLLNSLPGVKTFESCCGHGKFKFRVFFHCDSWKSLQAITESLTPGWTVRTSLCGAEPSLCFLLEGPVGSMGP